MHSKLTGECYCWGNSGATGTNVLNTVPDTTETYWDLHMSTSTVCAVRMDGKLRCWGSGTEIIENIPAAYQVD